MASYTEKFKLFKYNPTTDGESSFSINQALNENWDKIDEALANVCGLSIGDIGISLYVDESSGLRRRLNGTTVSINNNTRAFYNYLKNLQGLHPELFTTETNWQSEVTLSDLGQCGKFVIDDSAGTIRLPKVVNIQGVQDMAQYGMTVKAGLPNIEGRVYYGHGYLASVDGAFYKGDLGKLQRVAQGGAGNDCNLLFDASRSNETYGNSETVQPEAIQYPFFIQIATGAEEEVNIKNEIELNNPYTLFDSKYSEVSLYNASWLLSNGTYHSKSLYVIAYEALEVEQNLAIKEGTTQTLPSGTSYVKRGLSVKLSTEEYTDYDFVLNTSDETFRLPLKTGQAPLIAKEVPVIGNGLTLGLSNGTTTAGLVESSNNYANALAVAPNYYGKSVDTTTYFDSTAPVGLYGITPDPDKSGIVADLSKATVAELNLYFYVGETVQNANLIDAGRLQEQITEANAPSRGYLIDSYWEYLNIGRDIAWYRVYSDGWCEQGGCTGCPSSGWKTVNLYKTYKDIYYSIMSGGLMVPDSFGNITMSESFSDQITTSTFKVRCPGQTPGIYWETKGFLAEGEY